MSESMSDDSFEESEISHQERLINLVQGYPCLYDNKCPEFKEKGVKENAWTEIAKTLKIIRKYTTFLI